MRLVSLPAARPFESAGRPAGRLVVAGRPGRRQSTQSRQWGAQARQRAAREHEPANEPAGGEPLVCISLCMASLEHDWLPKRAAGVAGGRPIRVRKMGPEWAATNELR